MQKPPSLPMQSPRVGRDDRPKAWQCVAKAQPALHNLYTLPPSEIRLQLVIDVEAFVRRCKAFRKLRKFFSRLRIGFRIARGDPVATNRP
jgi:hypothetical protein